MNKSSPQLPLGLVARQDKRLETFFVGDNKLLLEIVRATAEQGDESQVALWGASGTGKSHLLNALCQCANEAGRSSVYLPMDALIDQPVDLLNEMEHFRLIAVDHIDVLQTSSVWQTALFNLINRSRQSGSSIVTASRQNPASLNLLEDLVSRLVWGPVLRVMPVSDASLPEAIRARAEVLGLSISAECINYLLTRHSRDLAELFAALDMLDRSSLVEQRRLTVPFIKTVLSPEASA
ncbi:MAG: DnaA regulatory inactivator Hda [Pseudomonadota bacterium]